MVVCVVGSEVSVLVEVSVFSGVPGSVVVSVSYCVSVALVWFVLVFCVGAEAVVSVFPGVFSLFECCWLFVDHCCLRRGSLRPFLLRVVLLRLSGRFAGFVVPPVFRCSCQNSL